jgi:hypothetical protein
VPHYLGPIRTDSLNNKLAGSRSLHVDRIPWDGRRVSTSRLVSEPLTFALLITRRV